MLIITVLIYMLKSMLIILVLYVKLNPKHRCFIIKFKWKKKFLYNWCKNIIFQGIFKNILIPLIFLGKKKMFSHTY